MWKTLKFMIPLELGLIRWTCTNWKGEIPIGQNMLYQTSYKPYDSNKSTVFNLEYHSFMFSKDLIILTKSPWFKLNMSNMSHWIIMCLSYNVIWSRYAKTSLWFISWNDFSIFKTNKHYEFCDSITLNLGTSNNCYYC